MKQRQLWYIVSYRQSSVVRTVATSLFQSEVAFQGRAQLCMSFPGVLAKYVLCGPSEATTRLLLMKSLN